MKDKYKVVIVGFAHVHINDVAKHFYEHPRIDLCGAADGAFGAATETALKRFQGRYKLGADGIAGQGTWGKLLGV